ncbi:hypothetical protein KUCAC02_013514, partial [Chaenocephalus aceratus]
VAEGGHGSSLERICVRCASSLSCQPCQECTELENEKQAMPPPQLRAGCIGGLPLYAPRSVPSESQQGPQSAQPSVTEHLRFITGFQRQQEWINLSEQVQIGVG